MPNNSKINPTSANKRRGLKIDQNIRDLYAKRSLKLDKDPDSASAPPQQMGTRHASQ